MLDERLKSVVADDGVRRVLKSVVLFEKLGFKRTVEWLEKNHVQGERSTAAHCVLAEYFRSVSGADRVSVSDHIYVGKFRFKTPPVLMRLWKAFDGQELPKLVIPETEPDKKWLDSILSQLKVSEVPEEEVVDSTER